MGNETIDKWSWVKEQTTMGSPAEILKQPYARVVTPEEDGSFRAEILEFPGCLAVGETEGEALASLANVAEGWLESTIAKGLAVPAPFEQGDGFSGKFVLRLSKSLHRRAAFAARRDGVSLNQFITTAIAVNVGAADPAPVATQTFQVASVVGRENGVIAFVGTTTNAPQQLASSFGQLTDLWKTMNSRALIHA